MGHYNRIIVIVLDSLGIGALPDAASYGDTGSNTICNVADMAGGLCLPNLELLGLGSIADIKGVKQIKYPQAAYGKMGELSPGKDTTTGHWEMMGIVLDRPFPTYPKGFPPDIVAKFEMAAGREVIGNIPASGTEIINKLGGEHVKSGRLILYTSADSVFQVAAHEDIVPLKELYEICEKARKTLKPPHEVNRVIARPFKGKSGEYVRTPNRHDYSVPPPYDSLLDLLKREGYNVTGIGKIYDIFCGRGVTDFHRTKSDPDGMKRLISIMSEDKKSGLIFINLIEFDMLYGHRNDYMGYANALMNFDSALPSIISTMRDEDLMIISADHGCDPTFPGTDHTREYVPLLVYSVNGKIGTNLGIRQSFSDVSATISENFGILPIRHGESFFDLT